MKDQKGNIGVIVSFIIVIGVIVLVVFILMNHKEKVNPMDELNKDAAATPAPANTSTNPTATNQEQPATSQKTMDKNTRLLSNFTPVSKVTKLEMADIVPGTGAEVKAGDTVSVQYTGAVAATGVIFQSSKDFGTDPVTFPLANVIKGWTDGIPGMKVGGTRRLLIPANQAYGANPPSGSGIPANADLVFDVELVAIK